MRLFRDATVVVGAHGAGLAGLLFSRRGTRVVEFALPEPHARHYAHASAALELEYWVVPMRAGMYALDMTVPVPPIADLVTRLFAGELRCQTG